MTVFAPKPTGRTVLTPATLSGLIFPWGADNQPVLLSMPESEARYLPVFTSADKLRELMGKIKIPYAKIKQIMDGDEFLASVQVAFTVGGMIASDIEVIVDPWMTIEGKVRYTRYP